MYLRVHIDTKETPDDNLCPVPLKEQILQQIKRFENHKSPLENNIQREKIKHGVN